MSDFASGELAVPTAPGRIADVIEPAVDAFKDTAKNVLDLPRSRRTIVTDRQRTGRTDAINDTKSDTSHVGIYSWMWVPAPDREWIGEVKVLVLFRK